MINAYDKSFALVSFWSDRKNVNKGDYIIMKKAKIFLLLGCLCLGLSACSSGVENTSDKASQGQCLGVIENNFNGEDINDETEVYFVEPIKMIDQVAPGEESKKVIQLISKFDENDYSTAVEYDSNDVTELSEEKLMLLFQNKSSDAQIFGYKSAEYGYRGIISYFNGKCSYFDIIWRGDLGIVDFFEQDFDNDGKNEIAFCFEGARGNGVEIGRLVMFDEDKESGTLVAYEFTPEMQLEQIEGKLQFIVNMQTKELDILKAGESISTINWEKFEISPDEKSFGVDCLNQVTFNIRGDEIEMCVGVGILLDTGGPTIFFGLDEGERLYLDVRYRNGTYELE